MSTTIETDLVNEKDGFYFFFIHFLHCSNGKNTGNGFSCFDFKCWKISNEWNIFCCYTHLHIWVCVCMHLTTNSYLFFFFVCFIFRIIFHDLTTLSLISFHASFHPGCFFFFCSVVFGWCRLCFITVATCKKKTKPKTIFYPSILATKYERRPFHLYRKMPKTAAIRFYYNIIFPFAQRTIFMEFN